VTGLINFLNGRFGLKKRRILYNSSMNEKLGFNLFLHNKNFGTIPVFRGTGTPAPSSGQGVNAYPSPGGW
jgi:hypothetical protein